MKKLIIISLILITGTLYLLTLPKGIGFGDSGTMAAAAVSLGIPHPPGFPTYILLAHLFSLLPVGSMLWRLQLLSLIPAIGIVILVFMIVSRNSRLIPALFAAFLTTFFYGFLSQVGNVESYMLTNFFIFGIIWLALYKRRLGIIGLALGLTAGLNPIGVVVLPVLLYLFRRPKERLIILLISGLTTILVYTYLPIRALAHPFLNWGNPQTISSFMKYITGSGLSISSDAFINGFVGSLKWFVFAWGRFGYLALTQLTPLVIALSLLGGWHLWKKHRTKFWVLTMILLANVSMAGIYISGNQDIWLVTSLIVLIIFAGEGLNRLGKIGWIVGIITIALVVWLSVPKILERTKTNVSEQYLTDVYKNLPKNSILVGGGETFNALTLYAYEVAKIRPDVTPIDMTIFYGQDWYRKNVMLSFPPPPPVIPSEEGIQNWIPVSTGMTKSQSGMTNIVDMPKFSDDLEFSRVLENFADINPNRPIFVTGYLLTQPVYANSLRPAYMPQKYQLEPHGIVYKLLPVVIPVETGIHPFSGSPIRSGMTKGDSGDDGGGAGDDEGGVGDDNIKHWPSYLESNYQKAIDLIRMEYALAYEIRGDSFLKKGKTEEAFSWYKRASEASPKYFDQNRLREKVAQADKLTN